MDSKHINYFIRNIQDFINENHVISEETKRKINYELNCSDYSIEYKYGLCIGIAILTDWYLKNINK